LTTIPAAIAAAAMHMSALAHGADDEGAQGWGLGLAVGTKTRPYRGIDSKVEVLPMVTFQNRWVRVMGPGVELKLGSAGPVAFGLTASYMLRDGYSASDSPFLAGMAKREASVWLGAKAMVRGEIADLSAEWSADGMGNSHGQKFRLGVQRRFALGHLGLTPRLAATWQNRHFVRYYYGVEADEALAGRPAYAPGATVNTEVGLRLDYRLTLRQMAFADLGLTTLGSAARNSPIVARGSVPEVRLGWLYRF
jgi:outer membrane protein